MRFITNKNKLDLQTKIKKTSKEQYQPWFTYKHKSLKELDNIVFWALGSLKWSNKS